MAEASPTDKPLRMLLELDDCLTPASEGPTSIRRFKDSIHDYRAYCPSPPRLMSRESGSATRRDALTLARTRTGSLVWADGVRDH